MRKSDRPCQRATLKRRLIDNAGTTAKRIDGLGSTFRPRYVRGNVRDIEALVNEMTEVCLFVPSAELQQKLDTRVVEVWFFNLARRLGAV
jgi:hypothetical protein